MGLNDQNLDYLQDIHQLHQLEKLKQQQMVLQQ